MNNRVLRTICFCASVVVLSAGCDRGDTSVTAQKPKDLPVTIDSLSVASASGAVDEVQLLLKAGVKPDQTDSSGGAPLIHAAWAGHDQVVIALIEQGADPNQVINGITPLLAAAGQGHTSVVALLARKGANVNATDSSGSTALIHAAFAGNLLMVKELLRAGANPALGPEGSKAIDMARGQGRTEVVDMLTAQSPQKP